MHAFVVPSLGGLVCENCVQPVVTCNSQLFSCSGYQDCIRRPCSYETRHFVLRGEFAKNGDLFGPKARFTVARGDQPWVITTPQIRALKGVFKNIETDFQPS